MRAGHCDPVEQVLAVDAEQVGHQHLDPALGQHSVDLDLAVRPQPDKLGTMPDQLRGLINDLVGRAFDRLSVCRP
jgi:hypothetical protein